MKKSNIFVHIELSKLASELEDDSFPLKNKLKSQAGYFNIITSKYFSDALSPEWELINRQVKDKGPKFGFDGKIVINAAANTIEHMSAEQCIALVDKIISLQQKVKQEFE